MLYNLEHILNDIEFSINNKKPFSIIRLGDGDLKLLISAQAKIPNGWKFKQQGIPLKLFQWILNIYTNSCNNANYISSFDVYFDGTTWPRPFSKRIKTKIKLWKDIYTKIGITNQNYCSPEIGFLFFLKEQKNLFSILKNKRICLVTCFPTVETKLKALGYNVSSLIIPGRNQNHFLSYKRNIRLLRRMAPNFDVFLVGAGALGRGYSNCIKLHGGRAVDIGQVFDAWAGYGLPKRVKRFLTINNDLTFNLRRRVVQFRKFF